MNNKIGLVTMCRKAGKLVMGMDMVKDACNTGKACAVFAATDFSPKSLKEIKFNCYKNGIKLYSLGMTMDDIHFGLGYIELDKYNEKCLPLMRSLMFWSIIHRTIRWTALMLSMQIT